ncbi:hypothetical protein [uncultured Roseobacter sp.]|uniref:hypothetical protein n=1 Tax=uncultured Roseobacter sp. TaxID=114847 RepID=UPI0026090C70|nr:hypothetical protein [uncultured Roseobacter sp.]
MTLRHYRTSGGEYLGGFVGASPPAGAIECPAPPNALATWDGSVWVAPVMVPETVSRFQAKAALNDEGLLTAAEAIVAAVGGTAQLAWNEAIEFRRDSPTIASLAPGLWPTNTASQNTAALDALFIAAAQIEV